MTSLIMYNYISIILYLHWNKISQAIFSSILIFYTNIQKYYMFITHL